MLKEVGTQIALWAFVAGAIGPAAAQDHLPTRTARPAPPPDSRNASISPQPNNRVHFHHAPKRLPPGAQTGDWPTLLGPTYNAVSPETKLLKHWPASGPTLVWEMETGTGYATPAVAADRLLLFHRVGSEAVVECLKYDTGERYWTFRYASSYKDRYGFNDGPRAGPVIDGDRVYVYGAAGKLHALNLHTGKLLWKRDLTKEFQAPRDFFGVGSTPLVEGDLLIVPVGAEGGPCVVAFDKRSGRLVWRAGQKWGRSYATPIPATIHGKRRLLVFAGGESRPPTGGLLSLDPIDGTIDFRYPFRSKRVESVNASSPVVIANRVFLSTSYGTGGVMLDLLGQGQGRVAWKTADLGCHFMTPIMKDGYLYGIDGMRARSSGITCLEWNTGRLMWRKQPEWKETIEINGEKTERTFSLGHGSLLRADGDFLCLSEYGHLLWLELSPQGYRELARTWLFAAQETFTPPVLSRGLLFVRQNSRGMIDKSPTRLLCYDLRAGEENLPHR